MQHKSDNYLGTSKQKHNIMIVDFGFRGKRPVKNVSFPIYGNQVDDIVFLFGHPADVPEFDGTAGDACACAEKRVFAVERESR